MKKLIFLIVCGILCNSFLLAMYLEIVPGGEGSTQYGAVSDVTGRLSIREVVNTLKLEDGGITFSQRTPLPALPMKLSKDDCAWIEITPPGGKQLRFTITPEDKGSEIDGKFWTWRRHLTWNELGVTSA